MEEINKADALKALIQSEIKRCKTIEDVMHPEGLIKQLSKHLIEGMLAAELDQHLGYEKHEAKGKNSGNSRNGYSAKTVKTSDGDVEFEIPRDRNSTFEPQVIKKHQKDLSGLENKIIAMYARGMSVRDIQAHLKELYGTETSPSYISSVTDKVLEVAHEWQNRPLELMYIIVYFDAIHYKVRDNGQIVSKAAYTSIGIDHDGKKEILGLWIGESEGARFWLGVFQELKNRGVNDILIACVDGLKGLPDAIQAVFPKTEVQLCIVHMIRNSIKFVGAKNVKHFLADLAKVYKAMSLQEAEDALQKLLERWQEQYPFAVKPWVEHWEHIIPAFKYPAPLRRVMYTTNTVEAFYRQLRKFTKSKAVFPNNEALLKQLYLITKNVKMANAVFGWRDEILPALSIIFGERIIMFSD